MYTTKVTLKGDADQEPGTVIAAEDGRLVVYWLWQRKQSLHMPEELEVTV